MEENKKKKGKGLIVLVIVLAILLLSTIGFICFGYNKYISLNNKYENINKQNANTNESAPKTDENINEITSQENNYITIKDIAYPDDNVYNLYAINTPVSVIGYNGKIYEIQSFGDESSCIYNFIYENNKGNVTFDKYSNYKCVEESEENDASYVYKTGIKETDVHKIVVSHHPAATDPSYYVFYILKDGSVKISGSSVSGIQSLSKLNEYKIKDIEYLHCTSGGKMDCEWPLKLEIVLKDNSKKTISITSEETASLKGY